MHPARASGPRYVGDELEQSRMQRKFYLCHGWGDKGDNTEEHSGQRKIILEVANP